MDAKVIVALGVFVAGIIFNAGGFVWLAKNHFTGVMKKLEEIDKRLRDLEIKVEGLRCRGRDA